MAEERVDQPHVRGDGAAEIAPVSRIAPSAAVRGITWSTTQARRMSPIPTTVLSG